MPYCDRCNASCELTDIKPTATAHMQQGTCTRCHNTVFFFTDIPLEAAAPAPAVKPVTPAPSQPSPETRTAAPSTACRPEMSPLHMYSVVGIGAVLLLIALIFLIKGVSSPVETMHGTAEVDTKNGGIAVTNHNSFNWTEVKVTLNESYTYTLPTQSLPSNGTCMFVFKSFCDARGHAINPAREVPRRLQIDAKNGDGHAGRLQIELKR